MKHAVALGRITVAACRGEPTRELQRARLQGVPETTVEEALLQLHLFAGYPAMINALFAWRRIAGPTRASGRSRRSRDTGRRICRSIYRGGYDALIQNMRALHPVLPGWVLADGYGRVMHRPGLPLKTRKLLVIAALTAQGAWRQLQPYLKATPGSRPFLRKLRGALPDGRLRRALAL